MGHPCKRTQICTHAHTSLQALTLFCGCKKGANVATYHEGIITHRQVVKYKRKTRTRQNITGANKNTIARIHDSLASCTDSAACKASIYRVSECWALRYAHVSCINTHGGNVTYVYIHVHTYTYMCRCWMLELAHLWHLHIHIRITHTTYTYTLHITHYTLHIHTKHTKHKHTKHKHINMPIAPITAGQPPDLEADIQIC